MKPLIAIVGPTAAGKSDLALYLAQLLGGEIINADSRQIYRHMDIGTAKPSVEERAMVPHHLFDLLEPNEPFSLALYQKLARTAIDDVLSQEKLPFLVGGSGLYVWSVLEGWTVPEVPPDPAFRTQMEDLAREQGGHSLYQRLKEIDPASAGKIDARNVRRVIRALEVHRATGRTFSEFQQKQAPDYDILIIGMTASRDLLYSRIDQRVEEQIKRGLVQEVRNLVNSGYSLDLPAMSSLGYKQVGQYLRGQIDLPSAVQRIKHESHRLARQQYAWFRLNDPRINWLRVEEDFKARGLELAKERIGDWLQSP